jgi:hypothetical protein
MISFKYYTLFKENKEKNDWDFLHAFGAMRPLSELSYIINSADSLPDTIKYHLFFSDFYKIAHKETEDNFIRHAYAATFENPEEMMPHLKTMEFSFEKFPMLKDCEQYYRLAQLPFPDFVIAILNRNKIEEGVEDFKKFVIEFLKNYDHEKPGTSNRYINMFSMISEYISAENILGYIKPEIKLFETHDEWRKFVSDQLRQYWKELCDSASLGIDF